MILRISRIVTFDTTPILVLPSQPISRLDASLNIHPVSSTTQLSATRSVINGQLSIWSRVIKTRYVVQTTPSYLKLVTDFGTSL